jgi:hypothetical protein
VTQRRRATVITLAATYGAEKLEHSALISAVLLMHLKYTNLLGLRFRALLTKGAPEVEIALV